MMKSGLYLLFIQVGTPIPNGTSILESIWSTDKSRFMKPKFVLGNQKREQKKRSYVYEFELRLFLNRDSTVLISQ